MKNEHIISPQIDLRDSVSEMENQDSHEYQIDEKRVFIVTPIYFADTGKTIYDVLLNLMLKHEQNH